MKSSKHRSIATASLFTLLILAISPSFRQTEKQKFALPAVVGNYDTTSLCLSPNYMLNAWYAIERMDSITDTLDLSKVGKDRNGLASSSFDLYPDKRPFSNDNLHLFVDTVNELTMTKRPIWARYLFNRVFSDSVVVLQDDTLIQQVKSFPIYIVNLSPMHMAKVGVQDGSLRMIVQAQDADKKWRSIEYWSSSWCGNSYYDMFIPARHMLMTRGVKCSGDFYTKCRMNLSNNRDSILSNEFYMTINETQFEMPVMKDR